MHNKIFMLRLHNKIFMLRLHNKIFMLRLEFFQNYQFTKQVRNWECKFPSIIKTIYFLMGESDFLCSVFIFQGQSDFDQQNCI